jgi:hypothetical protein
MMKNVAVVKGRARPANTLVLLVSCALSIGIAAPLNAQQEATAEEMAQANNPLASKYSLNLQNYYAPSLYGVPDQSTNTMWIRGVIPISRTVTRASLPLATRPSGSTESVSGLGDFNMFVAYLLVSDASTTLGLGPLLVAPTATDDALGQGKWQAGAALVAFKATKVVQVGGLLTWQGSFAGDSDRPSTSILATQPFAVWQLGKGTYLRSTGVWNFDLKSGDYSVPIGFGIGHVVKAGGIVYNIFFEPQFTILHDGAGEPKIQLFAGLNLQF